jgi:integrase
MTTTAESGGRFPTPIAVSMNLFDEITNKATKAMYKRAIEDFTSWSATQGYPSLCANAVLNYREHLGELAFSPSTINQRLSAIRRYAAQAAEVGSVSLNAAAEVIRIRGKSISKAVGPPGLTPSEAERLVNAPSVHTLKGRRDRALLSLLIGCGLRRRETASLQIEAIQEQSGRWAIIDLPWKRGSTRTVPVPEWVMSSIRDWLTAACISSGPLFCALNRHGQLSGRSLSEQAILDTVRYYGELVGIRVSPHDLRRTCAKLCRSFGGEIEQIQLLLGHSSVQVTAKYLEGSADYSVAANDHLPQLLHVKETPIWPRPVKSVKESENVSPLAVSL